MALAEMIADYFSKPLQGALFHKLRNLIMNYEPMEPTTYESTDEQECVGTKPDQAQTEPSPTIHMVEGKRSHTGTQEAHTEAP